MGRAWPDTVLICVGAEDLYQVADLLPQVIGLACEIGFVTQQ